jgi:hypothetical protein
VSFLTLAATLAGVPLSVTEHARWRAAERFPRFDTVAIEDEVRSALAAGRLSREREHLGLERHADPTCFYVWTADQRRVYALRADATVRSYRLVVTTTLRPER